MLRSNIIPTSRIWPDDKDIKIIQFGKRIRHASYCYMSLTAAASYDPSFTASDGTDRPIPLQCWHDEREGVWKYRRIDCLLNRLIRRRSNKTSNSASLAFVRGIHRWPANSPQHKGPVTREMFPLDDVIMPLTTCSLQEKASVAQVGPLIPSWAAHNPR